MSEFFGQSPDGYQKPLYAASNFSDVVDAPTARTNLGVASSDDVLKAANPIGTIISFYGSVAPYGYLPCSGQTVSNSTFPSLVTFLGGTTSATLPDLRGEFLRGWDNGRGIDTGRAVRTWQKGTMAVVDNTGVSDGLVLVTLGGNAAISQSSYGIDAVSLTDYPTQFVLGSTGTSSQTPISGNTGATRPRNISVLYCIKAYDTPVSTSLINITSLANEIAGRSTPALFDNTVAVATTAFVQRALGNMAGYTSYSTNTTLTSADLGKYIYATTSITLTLPDATAIPLGSRVVIQASAGATTVTITSTNGSIVGPASSAAVSPNLVISTAVSVDFVSNGTSWIANGGSGQASLVSSGYSKMSNGTIIQWGSKTTSASIGNNAVSFPIVFSNAVLNVTLGFSLTATANYYMTGVNSLTTTGFNIYNPQAAALVQYWTAIGY